MSRAFQNLTIANVIPEIDGAATSVIFDLPAEKAQSFAWTAGQHLTLRFVLDGQEERRSYTISNPPGAALRITVKRVKGGKVSNHIGDTLSAGDQIEVMPPFGSFSLTPDRMARRTHYFFGAGSGITPLFAMINAVLEAEPHSLAHLIYGNQNAKSIIFHDDLQALAAAQPERFTLRHVLSAPSLFSWFSPWRTGQVDGDAIAAAISETPPKAQDVQYWICGPGSMNSDVRSALMAIDVPPNRINMESFGGASDMADVAGAVAATAQIELGDATHDVTIDKGQTVLSAALKAGIDMPYSCQSGVCGACKARLVEGQVQMAAHMALDESEIAKGDILACQSVPNSERVKLRITP